jgi:hypothetical protein
MGASYLSHTKTDSFVRGEKNVSGIWMVSNSKPWHRSPVSYLRETFINKWLHPTQISCGMNIMFSTWKALDLNMSPETDYPARCSMAFLSLTTQVILQLFKNCSHLIIHYHSVFDNI